MPCSRDRASSRSCINHRSKHGHPVLPHPRALAIRAWQMFQSRNFSRVLEPSAGQGHRKAFTQAASQIAGRLHWTLSPDSLTRRDFVKGADARQRQAAQAMQQALEATLQARGYDVQALCLPVESQQLRLAA